MRARPAIATAITSGALAAALIASPAAAASTQQAEPGPADERRATRSIGECDGEGRDPWTRAERGPAHQGDQDGASRTMRGPRVGTGGRAAVGLADVPSGTLTDTQEATLIAMAEEEKLARDLYAAFAEMHSAPTFSRIADAEARHLEVVRLLLDRYGLADPTAELPAGAFATKEVQASYDAQLAKGSASLVAAYGVGRAVETADIAELDSALAGITAPDVQQVYTRLLGASQHHLEAFAR